MSTQKPLPKDLKQLEQKPRFKQFYKQHTIEQLEEKLIEAEIEYGSDENKAALVWRYMDAKGMDFDNQANDKPAQAEPAIPKTEEIKDNAENTPQAPKADTGNDGSGNDGQERSTDASTTSAPANDEVKGDQPASTQTQEAADHEQTDAPVSTTDNSLPTINSGSEEQPSASGENTTNKPDKPVEVKDNREFIEVTNNGAYNFYETATGTMVLARKSTKIYTTATIDKAHILRNLSQYNQTRGNLLKITNW